MDDRAETTGRHPAIVLGAFLAYQAMLIARLALLWPEGTLVTYGFCALAGAGYVACGMTGRLWSAVCLVLPLPIAWVASEWLVGSATSVNDEWGLAGTWLIWSFLPFLPAWVAGLLVGTLVRESRS
jgi:hypothetical protein